MKTLYTLFALASIPTSLSAQTAVGTLDVNEVEMKVLSNGLIKDPAYPNKTTFEVDGASTIFSSGLWIGGITSDSSLHLAAHMYDYPPELNLQDFYPGPLTVDGMATITIPMSQQYDRVWKINSTAIDSHRAYFECLNDPECDILIEFPDGYTIPADFLDWPAHGDVDQGQAQYLAPFVDWDQDGSYSPTSGDYPCVPGDQALYLMINDNTQPHTLSQALPLGIEVHMVPFAYTSDDPLIEQTVFVHYKIINRSSETIHDMYIGKFMDSDVGCPNDDLFGTDVGRNMAYFYNGTDVDLTCVGFTGFGVQPPAFGVAVIKGPSLDSNDLDDPDEASLPSYNGFGFGDGVADNERHGLSHSIYFNREGSAILTDPSQPQHFYTYLKARWKDATPMVHGGNGYPGSQNTVTASHMFTGFSDTSGVGTEGLPQGPWFDQPGLIDRRCVTSSGPFTLPPGGVQEVLMAFIYARAQNGGAFASVEALQHRADSIIAFAQNIPGIMVEGSICDQMPVGIAQHEADRNGLKLFPNPATNELTIDPQATSGTGTVQIFDVRGMLVMEFPIKNTVEKVNIDRLVAGSYVVRCVHERQVITGRFTKE